MDLMSIAQNLINQNTSDSVTGDMVKDGLENLFDSKDFDISSIMVAMAGNDDLSSIVGSWLGSGENSAISTDMIGNIFSSSQISGFASKLGLNSSSALSLLSKVLPDIVDQASNEDGGTDGIGGIDDALALAKKFF